MMKYFDSADCKEKLTGTLSQANSKLQFIELMIRQITFLPINICPKLTICQMTSLLKILKKSIRSIQGLLTANLT